MIKELAQYIADNTSFALGTTLHVGYTPADTQARATVILESSGGNTTYSIPKYNQIQIQFISRGEDFHDARDDSNVLFALLHGGARVSFPIVDGPEYVANSIEALAKPQYIGQDEKNRYQYSLNVLFRLEEK